MIWTRRFEEICDEVGYEYRTIPGETYIYLAGMIEGLSNENARAYMEIEAAQQEEAGW